MTIWKKILLILAVIAMVTLVASVFISFFIIKKTEDEKNRMKMANAMKARWNKQPPSTQEEQQPPPSTQEEQQQEQETLMNVATA